MRIPDKNKPLRVDIQEGASDDSNVEIISNRVKLGDEIIIGSTGGKKKSGASSNGNSKKRGGPPGMF